MTGLVTEFTTFYGTHLLGMFVTWKNTAVDSTGTVSGSTTLDIDMELNLYAASLDTTALDVLDATASAVH